MVRFQADDGIFLQTPRKTVTKHPQLGLLFWNNVQIMRFEAMKTPKEGPKSRLSRPFSGATHDRGRAIHAGSARQPAQATPKTLERGKEACYQDLTGLEKIQQQYRKRTALLHAYIAREVDATVRRYTVLEMANEASRNHLNHIAEQAKDLLLHYRQSEFVKKQGLQTARDLDEAPTENYEAYEATVEQCYRDLNNFQLPKLFLGKRLRWVLLVYLVIAELTLNGLYRYQILLPPALYYSIPIVVMLGLMVFALGKHYLWQYTQRELRDVYRQLMEAYDSAALLLRQDAAQIAGGLDQDLSQLQCTQEMQSSRLEHAKAAAIAHIATEKKKPVGR